MVRVNSIRGTMDDNMELEVGFPESCQDLNFWGRSPVHCYLQTGDSDGNTVM